MARNRRQGARLGAAVFVAGLSLAGPQALGLAAADAGENTTVGADQAAAGSGVSKSGVQGGGRRATTSRTGRADGRGSVSVTPGQSPDSSPAPAAARRARSAPSAAAAIAARSTVPAAAIGAGTAASASQIATDSTSGGGLAPNPPRLIAALADSPMAGSSAPIGAVGVSALAVAPTPVAAPAKAARLVAPARALADLNTGVRRLLDSVTNLLSTLPGPVADYLSGGLLILRRSLFNQGPQASPVQQTTDSAGRISGSVGAIDPENDPLSYAVAAGPASGTVSINADGDYLYTPGPEFAGTDSFTVAVTSTAKGINLLNLRADNNVTIVRVEVGAGATTNPFTATSLNDAVLMLRDTDAHLSVERQLGGRLQATVLLGAAADAEVLWLNEQGESGRLTLADVADSWEGIQNSGKVRLGLSYTLEDGSNATVILDDVEAAVTDTGQYQLSGVFTRDVIDTAGVNTYYDVIGTEYNADYDNFRRIYTDQLARRDTLELDIANANLNLDTFSVADYEQELETATNETSADTTEIPSIAAAAGAGGAIFTAGGLRQAVTFAQGGGSAASDSDPLFGKSGAFRPVCGSACKGTFIRVNVSTNPAQLVKTSFVLGDQNQAVDLSYDLGAASYGYLYIPDGIWDKVNVDKYSFAAMVALTTGPSVNLDLANATGAISYAPRSLVGADYSLKTPVGTLKVGGDVTAELDLKLGQSDLAANGKLGGSVYFTGGVLLTYNTEKNPGLQVATNYYVGSNTTDPNQITNLALTANLIPTLTGSFGINTPDSTPFVGRLSVLDFSFGYSNPLSASMELGNGVSDSFTATAAGNLSVKASLLPSYTKDLTYYKDRVNIYSAQTGNLLELVPAL